MATTSATVAATNSAPFGSPRSSGTPGPPNTVQTTSSPNPWSDTVVSSDLASDRTRFLVGALPTGRYDGITDVPGVLVNNFTKVSGDGVRDGVTVVMPNSDPWIRKAAAATYSVDGNGTFLNDDHLNASGRIDTPIVLCTAPDAGRVLDGTLTAMTDAHPEIGNSERIPSPLVAAIDGRTLNTGSVSASEVVATIAGAHGGNFARGSVGAGTPAIAFDYKAGTGSASRVLSERQGGYTVGVLVNVNTAPRERLTMGGQPVGRYLPTNDLPQVAAMPGALPRVRESGGGIDVVVATDAPLDSAQLAVLAKRTEIGLARSGAIAPTGSGTHVVAFSTTRVTLLDDDDGDMTAPAAAAVSDSRTLNALNEATADATESAVDDSLLSAKTMTGRGNVAYAIPTDSLRRVLSAPPPVTVQGSTFIAPLGSAVAPAA